MSLPRHVLRAALLAAFAAAQCAPPQKEDAEKLALRRRVAELEAELRALSTPTPVAPTPTPRPAMLAPPQPSPTAGTAVKRPARVAGVGSTAERSSQTIDAALPDDDMTQMLLDDLALRNTPPPERQATTAAAEHWSIPNGAQLELRLETTLSSRTSVIGDPVVARVERVADSDGPLPLPSGSIIEGRVTRVKAAGRVAGKPLLSVVFDHITVRGRRQALEPITATLEGRKGIERDGRLPAGGTGAALTTKAEELELHAGDRWIATVARTQRVQRD